MITLLKNAKAIDPAHNKDGVVQDIYIRDGRIIAKPADSEKINQVHDLNGKIVMAGAIDMHSHIGGGKVNIARMLLPEYQAMRKLQEPEAHICGANCSHHRIPPIPACAISRWATLPRLSLRFWRSMPARPIWKWATRP